MNDVEKPDNPPVTLEEMRWKNGKTMREFLERSGITPEYLIEKLKKELDATETKSFQFQGDTFESEEKIAWDVRQRARQDAHKLRGDYPAEKHEMEGNIEVEIVNYGSKDESVWFWASLDSQGFADMTLNRFVWKSQKQAI